MTTDERMSCKVGQDELEMWLDQQGLISYVVGRKLETKLTFQAIAFNF